MTSQSPLEDAREVIESELQRGQSVAEIATLLISTGFETSERSVRRAMQRWGLLVETPADQFTFSIEGDEGEIQSQPSTNLADPDELLRERKLDPEDWHVASATINEWDSPTGEVLKQLKVNIKRRKPQNLVFPAQIDLSLPAPKAKVQEFNTAKLVVLVGDQQYPYHNTNLHRVFCEWLRANKPSEGVFMGDTIDLPDISRHPDDPEWAATTQECINVAGQSLYDIRTASTDTVWTKLAGNHDERLRRAVINRLGDFYGLRPAEVETLPSHPPIHDPRHLLRLDELGIKYIQPNGDYNQAQLRLSSHLAARHGWIARKGSGSSALATLDHLGHSIVVGHTHRQSLVHQTKWDINGRPTTNVGVETGCMCRLEGGLGYVVAPDWQNGFATASIWHDGTFHIDLATYVDGYLYYRDQRFF